MFLIQMTGLSGAGKSTLANRLSAHLTALGYPVEILDGDQCRQHLWPELTFSDQDRRENLRRLGYLAQRFTRLGVIVLIAAINPFEAMRQEVQNANPNSLVVFIDCDLATLHKRDTKGLYARAALPDGHPNKLTNLTGINAPYERPISPNLTLETHLLGEDETTEQLLRFVLNSLAFKLTNPPSFTASMSKS